jgi:NADH-quinone oxidoreductase subunit A
VSEQLLPIVLLFAFVIVFGFVVVVLSQFAHTIANKVLKRKASTQSQLKLMSYECGVPGQAAASTKIPIKFYLTAISFILFDIEIVFLYPFALVYVENMKAIGGVLLLSVGIFVAVLVYGLFYEWKAKALEWD